MTPASLQEYCEWKKEASDISLPGVYIGLMDGLKSVSLVIAEATQELCATLATSYMDKVRETCNTGEWPAKSETFLVFFFRSIMLTNNAKLNKTGSGIASVS